MRFLLHAVVLVLVTWVAGAPDADAAAADAVTSAERERHAAASPRNLYFTRLTTRDGLSQNGITSIVQDPLGYVWFGTQEGLNRYDGYEVVTFEHDPDDLNSLANNWVWGLTVSRDGDLWVATENGGLNRYDPERGAFDHFRHDPNDINTLSSDRVRVVFEDGQNQLWLGTDSGGLNRMDLATGSVRRYRHDPRDPGSLPDDTILAIGQDHDGHLLIGTNAGLARFDSASERFVSDSGHGVLLPEVVREARVRSILSGRGGVVWVATHDRGLIRFSPETGEHDHFQHDGEQPDSLSHDRVRDIYEDAAGTVWIATDAGLNEWRPEADGFARYRHDPEFSGSLSSNRVVSLYQDRSGVLWVGTANGVNKSNPQSSAFTHYSRSSDEAWRLSGNMVTAVAENPDGALWVGSYGGGLDLLDRRLGVVRRLTHDATDPGSLSDARVMALLVGPDGTLWVGTRGGGLNRLAPGADDFERIGHIQGDPDSLSGNDIAVLHSDTRYLWVGTYGQGLNRINLSTGAVRSWRHRPDSADGLTSDRILALAGDGAGGLWIGTEDGGLNFYDGQRERITQIEAGFPSRSTWEIVHASNGTLWVGSMDAGVSAWTAAERLAGRPLSASWNRRRHLLGDAVLGLLEAGDGQLWIAGNRGLSSLDPDTGRTRHFDRHNGLRDDEFNLGARLRTRDGMLVFGGPSGLVLFDPEDLRPNLVEPEVALSVHSRFEELGEAHSRSPAPTGLQVDHTVRYLEFRFVALHYASSDKNRYRYMLAGFEDDWHDAREFRRATYTNLPPGSYEFRVKAANNDGLWSTREARVRLEVMPPWWLSPIAWTLYVALSVGLVAGGLSWQYTRSVRERAQRHRLEALVEDRTRELAERNDELEQMNARLSDASVSDQLTGLRNRRFVDQYVDPETARVDRLWTRHEKYPDGPTPNGLFFMMIDLDGFKLINDEFGHHAGDRALLGVRDRLLDTCRNSDIVVRWGGDEFLIVGEYRSTDGVQMLAERLRATLAWPPYDVGDGHEANLSGSIGFAPYPFVPGAATRLSWEQVVGLADRGAYLSKASGRNSWHGLYGTPFLASLSAEDIGANVERLIEDGSITLVSSSAGAEPRLTADADTRR